MLRWLLLATTVIFLALGVFNVVEAPPWTAWRLAVLAGEFGHWFAVAALMIAAFAWWSRAGHIVLGAGTLIVSASAAVLLLKPAFQAWRIGAALSRESMAQSGDRFNEGRVFSVTALFLGRNPPSVPFQTLNVGDSLPLDFYRANRVTGERAAPCVIVVHGGGWDSGDRKQIPHFNHWLVQQGYAVAAISYRLAPRFLWPAQREDVLSAIVFLKARASELGIDPTRLVLLGRSAGGQIALATAYTANDPAIRGVIAFYAPSDLAFGYVNTYENDMLKSPALMRQYLGGTPEAARANYESASALFHVDERTPPTLLLHGENDALVWHRHSIRLDARLTQQGIPHGFVSLPWATHAFDYNLHGPGGQLTTFAVGRFLAGVTK